MLGAVIMVKEKVLVKNPIGVHLRPAGDIAEAAIKFKKCEVYLSCGGRTVNGKSLLSILSLGIESNTGFSGFGLIKAEQSIKFEVQKRASVPLF